MTTFWRFTLGGLALAGLALLGPRAYTAWRYAARIQPTPETAASAPVAIVFGAGLRRDGAPTTVLQDRVATAVELYRLGKVRKLLLSGDNRTVDYNEPGAMRQAALALGVPDADLVLDYAGWSTYDTCYRARAIFGVTEAVLVTQAFHLPRALFTCEGLGVRATGAAADRRDYLKRSLALWHAREVLATIAAGWDLWVARPTPVLGAAEPILIP